MARALLIFIFFLIVNPVFAASFSVLNPTIKTGETLIIKFDEAPKLVNWNGKEITAFPYQNSWRSVAPVPLGAKSGAYKLTVEFLDGAVAEKTVSVSAKSQKVIVLPPPPKLGLTGKQIVQNLASANQAIRKTVEEAVNTTRFNEPFGLPLHDNRKISSSFGEIRKTGEESIAHLGVDFDNSKGRAVAAVNAGLVKNAYFDAIYGNSVIIDHGRGIYSLYMHLNNLKVKSGEAVKKGAVVGTVGDTGLASAPHLHLSLKVSGVSVDPIQFVSAFK